MCLMLSVYPFRIHLTHLAGEPSMPGRTICPRYKISLTNSYLLGVTHVHVYRQITHSARTRRIEQRTISDRLLPQNNRTRVLLGSLVRFAMVVAS